MKSGNRLSRGIWLVFFTLLITMACSKKADYLKKNLSDEASFWCLYYGEVVTLVQGDSLRNIPPRGHELAAILAHSDSLLTDNAWSADQYYQQLVVRTNGNEKQDQELIVDHTRTRFCFEFSLKDNYLKFHFTYIDGYVEANQISLTKEDTQRLKILVRGFLTDYTKTYWSELYADMLNPRWMVSYQADSLSK